MRCFQIMIEWLMAMGHAPRSVGVLCSSAVLAWILIVALSQEALSQEDASAVDAHARYSDLGADTCLGCHNNEDMLLIFRTPHGQGADPEAPVFRAGHTESH